jgi:hypothetical protein
MKNQSGQDSQSWPLFFIVRQQVCLSTRDVIATGLFLPTAMTFGPDGALYVSNFGFGVPPDGEGPDSENHGAVSAESVRKEETQAGLRTAAVIGLTK